MFKILAYPSLTKSSLLVGRLAPYMRLLSRELGMPLHKLRLRRASSLVVSHLLALRILGSGLVHHLMLYSTSRQKHDPWIWIFTFKASLFRAFLH
jgi:hypothetical protein